MAANHNYVQSIAAPTSTTVYTQVFSSTPQRCCKIVIASSGDSITAISIGAAGSEVDLVAVGPGSTVVVDLSINVLPAGSRIAAIASGTVNASGYVTVSLIP